jgi:hypothetical protein
MSLLFSLIIVVYVVAGCKNKDFFVFTTHIILGAFMILFLYFSIYWSTLQYNFMLVDGIIDVLHDTSVDKASSLKYSSSLDSEPIACLSKNSAEKDSVKNNDQSDYTCNNTDDPSERVYPVRIPGANIKFGSSKSNNCLTLWARSEDGSGAWLLFFVSLAIVLVVILPVKTPLDAFKNIGGVFRPDDVD